MTEPMPLAEAVRICFPFGGVTKSTLLAAIRSGVLDFERIGRAYFVTEANVMKWREKCRGVAKAHGSKSTGAREGQTDTSSATDRAAIALDALRYGVDQTAISAIVRRATYQHVT